MTKLLFIKASPRKESAVNGSIAVAQAYLDAFTQAHPDTETDIIDLWRDPLPQFDGDKAGAKMSIIYGQEMDGTQRRPGRRSPASSIVSRPQTSTCSPSPCGTAAFPTGSNNTST